MTYRANQSNTIDRDSLQTLLKRNEPVLVLDIRPMDERSDWAIPGSLHLDMYEALQADDYQPLDSLQLPEDIPVVTVCGAGKTSQKAADYLQSNHINAYSLSGGMRAWSLAWNTAETSLAGDVQVLQVRRTGKGCLSYLIASNNEAALIDPALPSEIYRRLAEDRQVRITAVLDTHVHADHLSRSRHVAEHAGARLYQPAQDRIGYEFTPVRDGDRIRIGSTEIEAISTPGHTGESTTYHLDETALFTGDTLFTNSVGRPDLETGAAGAEKQARQLYQSLQRLLAFPEAIRILPAHTGEPVPFDEQIIQSTVSAVRAEIPLLSAGEDDFVDYLISHLPRTPANHRQIVEYNESGDVPADAILDLEGGANRCAIGN